MKALNLDNFRFSNFMFYEMSLSCEHYLLFRMKKTVCYNLQGDHDTLQFKYSKPFKHIGNLEQLKKLIELG